MIKTIYLLRRYSVIMPRRLQSQFPKKQLQQKEYAPLEVPVPERPGQQDVIN